MGKQNLTVEAAQREEVRPICTVGRICETGFAPPSNHIFGIGEAMCTSNFVCWLIYAIDISEGHFAL